MARYLVHAVSTDIDVYLLKRSVRYISRLIETVALDEDLKVAIDLKSDGEKTFPRW